MKKNSQEDYKTYRKFVRADGTTMYKKCFHNGYGIEIIHRKEGTIIVDVILGNDIEPYHEMNYVNGKVERYTNVSEADIPKYIQMVKKRPNEEYYLDSAGEPIGLIEHKITEMMLILSKFQRFRKTNDPKEIKPHLKKLHKKADEVTDWIIMLENYCQPKN